MLIDEDNFTLRDSIIIDRRVHPLARRIIPFTIRRKANSLTLFFLGVWQYPRWLLDRFPNGFAAAALPVIYFGIAFYQYLLTIFRNIARGDPLKQFIAREKQFAPFG